MDNGGEPFAHILTVTEKQYEALEYLENYGGFLRFRMSLYDEGAHVNLNPDHRDILLDALKTVFTGLEFETIKKHL